MTCHVIESGGVVVGFACSRGPRKTNAPCAYCKNRPYRFLCDAPLRGKRTGKTCDGRICESCATQIGPDAHLCPPHRRERDAANAKAAESADAWLDDLAQSAADVSPRKVSASQDAAVPSGDREDLDKVDRAELARMFPDWDPRGNTTWWNDRDNEPPANAIAGEIRARADDRDEKRPVDMTFDPDRHNMYGCTACPSCKATQRWPHRSGMIICDDCGHEVPGKMVDGGVMEIWIDVPPRTIREKVSHVREAKQTRDHACHWPGCTKQVEPAKWGCAAHWFQLPKDIRNAIWFAYVPGQENTGRPTRAYLDAANAAQAWIETWLAANTKPPRPSWSETVNRTRAKEAARPRFEHPDPAAENENSWAGDMTESEFDPNVGDR